MNVYVLKFIFLYNNQKCVVNSIQYSIQCIINLLVRITYVKTVICDDFFNRSLWLEKIFEILQVSISLIRDTFNNTERMTIVVNMYNN